MNSRIKSITRTAILLALTVVFQSLKLGQFFTGPLVNAVLLISACAIGWPSGVVIGAATPWIALLVGILKPVLAPAVPFIMIGNALLVIVFYFLKPLNSYIAVLASAVIKFGVLYVATRFILHLNPSVSSALQFPQLITAIVGGFLALIVISALNSFGFAPRMGKVRNKIKKL
ncbi:MAG: hypothetical protein PWQ97_542 [Tepidanaerobacteraceae bacterium]|nr:hypothetical protein [Tepidanaerobacteraceae bacterium]